jgi:hypothetical protein
MTARKEDDTPLLAAGSFIEDQEIRSLHKGLIPYGGFIS